MSKPTPFDDLEYLSRSDCAKYLTLSGYRVSADRLAHLACHNNAGNGPPFYQVKWNRVFYQRMEVDAWLRSVTQRVE